MTARSVGSMPRRGPKAIVAALLMTGAALSFTTPAVAQFSNTLGGPVVGTAPPPKRNVLPPVGVPGAAAVPGGTPSASSQAKEMSPTDELFDAINRGDLATARDAIGRGAQLDAKNILGMTPLEDAVDLNRNDIAFLLLSIEHEHTAAAHSANASLTMSAPPAAAASPQAPSNAVGSVNSSASVADLLVANGAPPAAPAAGHPVRAAGPVRAADPVRVIPAAPVTEPPGGGEGSPDPAVGFLGFGTRAVGAAQN